MVSIMRIAVFCILFSLNVRSMPSLNSIIKEKKPYYPSLNDKIVDLKEKMRNAKIGAAKVPANFDDPDCNRTALELITSKSYAGEVHYVTTLDHYILGIQRIPAPQFKKPDGSKKPAVLVWHGVNGCAVNWIANEANNSLGFMLADAGYDVWLGNSRGNAYSTDHEFLNPTNAKFWKFSWDQMAGYDLTATIDYILEATGNEYLYYVGHSQGTLIGFAEFSSDTVFANKNIKAFFALAPIGHVGHVGSSIEQAAAKYVNDIRVALDVFGYNDFLPPMGFVHKQFRKSCSDDSAHPEVCNELTAAVFGSDTSKLNQSRLGVIMAHCPAGTSSQNMVHFGQMVNSDLMQAFDYTLDNKTEENQKHYGQDTAPLYNVQNLQVPTIVFHSDADETADPTDVAWLLGQIQSTIVADYHYTDYAHTDFIWALRAAEDVYPNIISWIKHYEST